MTEMRIQTHDGLALAAWRYPAEGRRARARVVLVHGYAEHMGRYTWLTESLVAAGYDCDLFDLRGHGRSGGSRGHVARFADYWTTWTGSSGTRIRPDRHPNSS